MPTVPAPAPADPLASATTLALGLGASVLVGALLAFAMARLLNWTAADGELSVQQSIAAGAAAMAFGAIIGLTFLWSPACRTATRLGLMVLAASSTRMLVALSVLVVVLFTAKPAVYPLVASLAAGFFLCLVVESLWAVAALRRAGPAASPTPLPHASALPPGAVAR